MRKQLLFALLLSGAAIGQQSQIDIAARTRGNLPVSRLLPGVAGQCLTTDIGGNTTWGSCASGSGTVTTFSAGALTPLFTTSVATPTSTPALTFALSNFAAHAFFGNNTSGSAAPAAVQPKSTDLADFSATAPTTSGKIPIFDQPSGTYIPGDPLVQGLVADTSTTAENPVTIGGYDTAGTPALHRATFINGNPAGTEYGQIVRNIPSGTQPISGSVSVSNFPATQPVSGTVAATQSGTWTVQPGNTANTTAWKVDGSAVTQPVSGTVTTTPPANASSNVAQINGVTPLMGNGITGTGSPRVTIASDNTAFSVNAAATQSGTWTVQPGNTANTTAWKVDGSAVTQPISAASLPLPTGAATSANQSTVKAASTASVATDTSSVVQISPNQPQLTTPLNIQGGKTNNNAAPGATNVGTLPSLANAAPPTNTEGNQVSLSIDLKGNLRVNNHPPDVLGCYMVNGRTGTYGGQAALAPLFSFRWGDATHLAVIQSVKINVATITAATAATQAERELIIARTFTASDTGGTSVTMTGNNQKMRTNQATSLVTNIQFGQPLTAGTRTLDANPVSSVVSFLAINMTGMDIGCGSGGPFVSGTAWTCVGGLGMVPLLDVATGDYPIVLAQNEGIIVRIGKDAQPTGAVQQTYVTVKWCEVNAF